MTFFEKYNKSRVNNASYVCVGLDSDITKLPEAVKNDKNPILTFNKAIIDATKDLVVSYKPNLAFYLSAGKMGLDALFETFAYIPSDIPVILDAKFGDIGNTMFQYGKFAFEQVKADALTVNPLMGEDVDKSIESFEGKMKFLLCLTSNPGARDYLMPNELYTKIAAAIGEKKDLGAVVGGTNSEQLEKVRSLMPETVFLIPGIGAQGGNLELVCQKAAASKEDARFVINSSRGIIFADSSADFAETAAKKADELRKAINENL